MTATSMAAGGNSSRLGGAAGATASAFWREQETGHNKSDKAQTFYEAGDLLRPAARTQAEPIEEHENDEKSDGNLRSAPSQRRYELDGEFAACGGDESVPRRLHHAIAAADKKSSELAEGPA